MKLRTRHYSMIWPGEYAEEEADVTAWQFVRHHVREALPTVLAGAAMIGLLLLKLFAD